MAGKARFAALAGIVTVAMLIAGCTTSKASPMRSDLPVSDPTSSAPPELAPLGSLEGTVILRLDDQSGGVVYGPFKRSSNRIVIDFNCLGLGTATVTVVGVAEFPNECGGAGSSVRNTLDMRFVDSFVVKVDGPGGVRWSLGVTQIDE